MPLSQFVPAYPSPSPCPQVHSLRLHLYSCPALRFFTTTFFFFSIPFICVSIRYLFFSFWLTSLCMTDSRFSHLYNGDSTDKYHNSLNHYTLLNIEVGCFSYYRFYSVMTITKKAAMTHFHFVSDTLPFWKWHTSILLSFLLNKFLEMSLKHQRICAY